MFPVNTAELDFSVARWLLKIHQGDLLKIGRACTKINFRQKSSAIIWKLSTLNDYQLRICRVEAQNYHILKSKLLHERYILHILHTSLASLSFGYYLLDLPCFASSHI